MEKKPPIKEEKKKVDPENPLDAETLALPHRSLYDFIGPSILYALIFFIVIALMTLCLFFSTRHLIATQNDDSSSTDSGGMHIVPLDPDKQENRAFIFKTINIHPARQLVMRIRDTFLANKGRIFLVIAGLVLFIYVISSVVSYFNPPIRYVRRKPKPKPQVVVPPTPWFWWLGFAVLVIVVLFVLWNLIYTNVYRNSNTRMNIVFRGNNVTIVSSRFTNYKKVKTRLKETIEKNSEKAKETDWDKVNLYYQDSGALIDLEDPVPTLAPFIVASPPLAILKLMNFNADYNGKRLLSIVPVEVPGGKKAFNEILKEAEIVFEHLTEKTEEGAATELGKDTIIEIKEKLSRTFILRSDHLIRFVKYISNEKIVVGPVDHHKVEGVVGFQYESASPVIDKFTSCLPERVWKRDIFQVATLTKKYVEKLYSELDKDVTKDNKLGIPGSVIHLRKQITTICLLSESRGKSSNSTTTVDNSTSQPGTIIVDSSTAGTVTSDPPKTETAQETSWLSKVSSYFGKS